MGTFIKGDVVVVPFPFSNLASSKRRPALVLADLMGDDIILCQITSQVSKDTYAIPLIQDDFENGTLQRPSYIRPNRIFTADKKIILYKIGDIKEEKLRTVYLKVLEIVRNSK